MQITIDELVENPEKYFAIVNNEDIFITRDGEEIARVTRDLGETREALRAVEALTGILPPDVDLEAARRERFLKIDNMAI